MLFTSLGIIEPILRALSEEGYTIPTPIQSQSIPIILQGSDLLGCAQTGTGKTAAFAIPMIQLLSRTPLAPNTKRKIRSLIVTPTRELAIQIGESFASYGRHTSLKHTVIFGGVGQHTQVSALKSGVDIVIATPGRLLDLISQGYIDLSNIEIFTLDEADRMLDMGFVKDIKKILALLPKKRQSLFFSATMPANIIRLADTILRDPKKVTVTPVSSTVEIIQQSVYFVDKGNKHALLLEVLKNTEIKTALVFTRTKHCANKVVEGLLKNNISAEAIHGNKAQNARQRALANFKSQTTRILVATDIAARGIDVDELEYVINYEMSNIAETYVHRIGRTGRAGAKGSALSFCDAEEKEYLRDTEKLIAKKIPVIEDHPFPLRDHSPISTPKGSAPRPNKRGPRGTTLRVERVGRTERRATQQSKPTPGQHTQKIQQPRIDLTDTTPRRGGKPNRPGRSPPRSYEPSSRPMTRTKPGAQGSQRDSGAREALRGDDQSVRRDAAPQKGSSKQKREFSPPPRGRALASRFDDSSTKESPQPKSPRRGAYKSGARRVAGDGAPKRASGPSRSGKKS